MNAKQEKKRRKFLREAYRRDYQETAIAQAKYDARFLKPKPRWVPYAIWRWALGFFVRINKS